MGIHLLKKREYKYTKEMIIHAVFCVLFFIYEELLFHIATYKGLGSYWFYPVLFALPAGVVLIILTSLFKPVVNRIVMYILIAAITCFYDAELLYQHVFKAPLLLNAVNSNNAQVMAYYREILNSINECMLPLVLSMLPLIALVVLTVKGVKYSRKSIYENLILAICAIIISFYPVGIIRATRESEPVVYENYHEMFSIARAMEDFGVITGLRMGATGGSDTKIDEIIIDAEVYIPPKETEQAEIIVDDGVVTIDVSPNILDIDFVGRAAGETDATLKKQYEYYATVVPTKKNVYTGMFADYNLIMITAEAFSPYCIDKELTPTLYKIANNGFVFTNFYTPPTGESTAGGEFMNLSGLYTVAYRSSGLYSIQMTQDNYMPFTLGNFFSEKGIATYAYHNGDRAYYGRNKTLPNYGYSIYKGGIASDYVSSMGDKKYYVMGLENPNLWPQSDLEMINATISDYTGSREQFHTYYMTISGHLLYTFSGNCMASKNKELVKDLPYSEACKAYIACNIELDRALESLMNSLDEEGVLDKTVICIGADHYPYGLKNEEIEELAGKEINEVELYKNTLIMYNSAMKTPVITDKECSSVDILPTLLNLWGFEYDSRLLAGRDILSDSPGYVIFPADRTFITEGIIYSSTTGATMTLDYQKADVDSDWLKSKKSETSLRLTMNQLLIESDFYRVLKNN